MVCRIAAQSSEATALSPLWDARPAGVLFLGRKPAGLGRTRPKPSPILGRAVAMAETERCPAGIIALLRVPTVAANRIPIDAIPTQIADRDNF